MKQKFLLLIVFLASVLGAAAQSNNALSIFEGERIQAVNFRYADTPADTVRYVEWMRQVENTFAIYPYTHYNGVMIAYYLAQVRQIPFVLSATVDVTASAENGVIVTLYVQFGSEGGGTTTEGRKKRPVLPVLYSRGSSFLTLRASASQMAYSDGDAWFAQPAPLLAGNPLVDGPAGKGYTGWVEGFGMAGLYGIVPVVKSFDLHLYGGANYIVSFSAGRELFTDRSRFHGGVEDAFVGVVGGGKTARGRAYSYNLLYGRKQFVLGNGWLIVNTAMNGEERAALQLNPRRAAKSLLQGGGKYGNWMLQYFRLEPNELPILDSHTILEGPNLEWSRNDRLQIGATVIHSPRSNVHYYQPDGTVLSRKGLWVYNLRFYGNTEANRPGLFYKTELGLQTNEHFPMRAWAGYAMLGWNFARTYGQPALSYRFAYFSGDNPDTRTFERWDPLYTGGNGEQWVQGSNMYKVVQNSNEMTHLLQLVWAPYRRWQTVTQLWAFFAPQTNNLGGNPGLSTMKGHYYGAEVNLTAKYFLSRRWYFHLNTALTFPGDAIRGVVPGTKPWFSLMAFVQYTW